MLSSYSVQLLASKHFSISCTSSNVVAYVAEKVASVETKIGNVGADKGTVTDRINAIEEELAAATTFEPISDADIEALFA